MNLKVIYVINMNKKIVVSDDRINKEELLKRTFQAIEILALDLPEYINNPTSFIIELNIED